MLALLLALALPSYGGDTGFDTGFDTGLVAPPIVGGTPAPAGKWNDTAGVVIGSLGIGGLLAAAVPAEVIEFASAASALNHARTLLRERELAK